MPIRKPPFQALTLKASGRANRLITSVDVCEAFDHSNPPKTLPTRLTGTALWDTGATNSVVTPAFANSLGLVPTGTRDVRHGGGMTNEKTYVVNFYLPNGVGIIGLVATELKIDDPEFNAIIGMDVIGFGDFAITNFKNQTWMSFRTPSHAAVDYVVESDRYTFANMGRNEPCYCGSGQKFKKCHGANF